MTTTMLIKNDTEIRQFVPNAFATCEGEKSLFDKLQPYLNIAERWLSDNVVGKELLTTLASTAEDDERKVVCCQIVAADAFQRAIPSLDLVLTPNGFGIVSNGNVAPASSERVKTLSESLTASRDELIHTLLLLLSKDANWRTSAQGMYFGATLFPNLELVRLAGRTSDVWRNYQTLRQQIISIEDELAERYISQAIYTRLRQHVLEDGVKPEELPLVRLLKQTELELVAGKQLNVPRLISLVQRIREDEQNFPEWKTSPTAELFSRQSFQNEKHSGGYWW